MQDPTHTCGRHGDERTVAMAVGCALHVDELERMKSLDETGARN